MDNNSWRVRDQLTITTIEREWCRVYIQTDYDPRHTSVIVGDRRLGRPYPGQVYDGSVEIIRITLSDGQTYQVASREIRAFKPKEDRDHTYYDRRRGHQRRHIAEPGKVINVPRHLTYNWNAEVTWDKRDERYPHRPHYRELVEFHLDPKLTWEIARYLAVGTVFAEYREYPFSRTSDGALSNGVITIPAARPFCVGRTYTPLIAFAQSISSNNWPIMLRAIEGAYYDGINSNDHLRDRIASRRRLDRIERRVRDTLGACFSGHDIDLDVTVHVGLGERCLFHLTVNGQPRYIVDAPRYGHALFVFSDRENAERFANGGITPREAKAVASHWISHHSHWREHVRTALTT